MAVEAVVVGSKGKIDLIGLQFDESMELAAMAILGIASVQLVRWRRCLCWVLMGK